MHVLGKLSKLIILQSSSPKGEGTEQLVLNHRAAPQPLMTPTPSGTSF